MFIFFFHEKEIKKKRIKSKMNYINRQFYSVDIDFDTASKEWRANKKSKGYGYFSYRCIQITKKGKKCKREACPETDYCKIHRI